MRAIVTRVSRASITIDGVPGASMGKGFVVLLGICQEDTEKEVKYLADRCAKLRVFEDENGKMNRSLADVGGEIMLVSNFTLYGNCASGRRPDFMRAGRPSMSEPLYEAFIAELKALGVPLHTGSFGADMQIDHVNDGPVTLILDTAEMMRK